MAGGSKNMDGISALEKKTAEPAISVEAEEQEKAPEMLMSWSAPSFAHKDKNFVWFLAAGLIVLALIIFFIFTKDWFSIGITVVVSAVLFWYVAKVKPSDTDYSITELGIYAGKHYYPFSEIHSYWMVYNDKIKTLNIAFLKKYLPTLIINIENVNPLSVKKLLLPHIPEQEKRGESLVDQIIRTIGL